MLSKQTIVGNISVVGKHKGVHVAMDTLVYENGNLISQTRKRYVLHPDMDITNQPAEIQNICNTAWTQEVKDAWIAFKAAQEAELNAE